MNSYTVVYSRKKNCCGKDYQARNLVVALLADTVSPIIGEFVSLQKAAMITELNHKVVNNKVNMPFARRECFSHMAYSQPDYNGNACAV